MSRNNQQPPQQQLPFDPMYEFDSPKFYDFANIGMNNSDVCDSWFEKRAQNMMQGRGDDMMIGHDDAAFSGNTIDLGPFEGSDAACGGAHQESASAEHIDYSPASPMPEEKENVPPPAVLPSEHAIVEKPIKNIVYETSVNNTEPDVQVLEEYDIEVPTYQQPQEVSRVLQERVLEPQASVESEPDVIVDDIILPAHAQPEPEEVDVVNVVDELEQLCVDGDLDSIPLPTQPEPILHQHQPPVVEEQKQSPAVEPSINVINKPIAAQTQQQLPDAVLPVSESVETATAAPPKSAVPTNKVKTAATATKPASVAGFRHRSNSTDRRGGVAMGTSMLAKAMPLPHKAPAPVKAPAHNRPPIPANKDTMVKGPVPAARTSRPPSVASNPNSEKGGSAERSRRPSSRSGAPVFATDMRLKRRSASLQRKPEPDATPASDRSPYHGPVDFSKMLRSAEKPKMAPSRANDSGVGVKTTTTNKREPMRVPYHPPPASSHGLKRPNLADRARPIASASGTSTHGGGALGGVRRSVGPAAKLHTTVPMPFTFATSKVLAEHKQRHQDSARSSNENLNAASGPHHKAIGSRPATPSGSKPFASSSKSHVTKPVPFQFATSRVLAEHKQKKMSKHDDSADSNNQNQHAEQ